MDMIQKASIHIAVASNSIYNTIEMCLVKLGIRDYVEKIFSNEALK